MEKHVQQPLAGLTAAAAAPHLTHQLCQNRHVHIVIQPTVLPRESLSSLCPGKLNGQQIRLEVLCCTLRFGRWPADIVCKVTESQYFAEGILQVARGDKGEGLWLRNMCCTSCPTGCNVLRAFICPGTTTTLLACCPWPSVICCLPLASKTWE